MVIAVELSDQVVIVTGSSGTIGSAAVDTFAAAGATIVRVGRGEQPPVAAGTRIVDVVADLAAEAVVGSAANDADPAASVFAAALDACGRVDAVVNVAGVQSTAPLAAVDGAQLAAMFAVNVTAAHRLTALLAAHVAARGAPGAVVHVASIEATRPALDHGLYAMSKAALVMHARAAALEFGPLGVRVNAVSPGLVERPGIADAWPDGVARWLAAAPLGRLGRGADVAAACAFLCSPLASFVTGAELVVDGGVSARPGW